MTKGSLRAVLRIAGITYIVAVIFVIALILGQVLSAKYNVIYYYSDLRALNTFEYAVNKQPQGTLELPAVLVGLTPNDTVTLTGTIEARLLDNILIDDEHTPLQFFVNDRLYYEVGGPDTFPDFQKEPPNVVKIIALPESPQYLDLRLEYKVPEIRSSVTIPVMYVGDADLLVSMIIDYNVVTILLSSIMLIGSIILVIVGLVTIRRVSVASIFIWLGLTCLATSLWTLCANKMIIYLIPQPSLLYTLSYIGLFGIVPPFVCFNRSILSAGRNWFVRTLYYISAAVFVAILILHVTSVISFGEISPIMYVIVPVLLVVFIIAVIIEQLRYQNPLAIHFIISCTVVVMFTILETINGALNHFVPSGLFFQLGLMFFVFELSVLAWRYVNDALDATEKNAQLQLEIASTNRALDAQRTLYETLTMSNEEIRKVRHDLRHQLSVIRGFVEDERKDDAIEYLDKLYGTIPSTAGYLLCDNFAINALVAHYLTIAKEEGIQIDLKLVVPETMGRIPDNDLSVIIGNLLENAIEACGYVDEHKRFIKMQSSVDKLRFTLIMDNSYDGQLVVLDDEFFSRKRSGKGIGMASVRTMVQKYDGTMKYEAADGVFKTSLYVKM